MPAEPVRADSPLLPVAVLVLARDEEANLPDCLHSVRGWVEQIAVLVDPRTTDATREVAVAAGAEVFEHPFESFGLQRNWALAEIPWRQPWLLIVDADERVSPQLRDEIAAAVTSAHPKAAYAMRLRFIFYGQWIKHCWHSTWNVRLFQLNKARYEPRAVHEHVMVDGELGLFQSDSIHNDFKDIHAWIEKHNHYATLEADETRRSEGGPRLRGKLFGNRLERRRFLKEKWKHLPFRPMWLFLYLYIGRLGILDGALGFRFCLMKALFEALVTAKVWEHKRLAAQPAENYYRKILADYLARYPHARRYYD